MESPVNILELEIKELKEADKNRIINRLLKYGVQEKGQKWRKCNVGNLQKAFNKGAKISNSECADSNIDFALTFNPSIAILECLINEGAKLDCNGWGSISKVLESPYPKFNNTEELLKILNFLKVNKANVNGNVSGIIYHALEYHNKPEIIEWLYKNGAEIDKKESGIGDIEKALKVLRYYEGEKKRVDLLRVIIENGAEINEEQLKDESIIGALKKIEEDRYEMSSFWKKSNTEIFSYLLFPYLYNFCPRAQKEIEKLTIARNKEKTAIIPQPSNSKLEKLFIP